MPFEKGGRMIRGILDGMLQFTLVSVGISIILFCRWLYLVVGTVVGQSQEGQTMGITRDHASDMYKAWENPLMLVKGLSLGYAMYCTFLMLKETERNEELEGRFNELNPEEKFWGIKLLIGVTMFQKFVFAKAVPHFLPLRISLGGKSFSPEDFGVAMQSLLMCFELLLFAISHIWIYPLAEGGEPGPKCHWYDGPFVTMCRFSDNEGDFKFALKKFREKSRQAEAEEMRTMKSDLEEKFKTFHPDGEKKFSPYVFEFHLKAAGYSVEEIKSLKICAKENVPHEDRRWRTVKAEVKAFRRLSEENEQNWHKFCTDNFRGVYDVIRGDLEAQQGFVDEQRLLRKVNARVLQDFADEQGIHPQVPSQVPPTAAGPEEAHLCWGRASRAGAAGGAAVRLDPDGQQPASSCCCPFRLPAAALVDGQQPLLPDGQQPASRRWCCCKRRKEQEAELGPFYVDYHDLCNKLDEPVPVSRQGTRELG